jgi:uncharacterized protein (TIGR00255 family)
MPKSMTGFARRELQAPWGTLSCEIRSVNHRYLEPIIRLPESLRALEVAVRDQCRKQLQRGKVEVNIQLNVNAASPDTLALNQTLIEQLAQAANTVTQAAADQNTQVAPIDPLRLLQWPGVIEQQNIDNDVIEASAKTLLADTLALLIEHRAREGVELQGLIEQRLVAISEYVDNVRQQMPEILQAQHVKLQQRLQDLQLEVEPERLAQEVAILANKVDVEEELDRLSTHIGEVRHILSQKGAIGRRLDFMMQELNREANTLSSKAIHTDTTNAAVSLKVLIEQMREQIQNIE